MSTLEKLIVDRLTVAGINLFGVLVVCLGVSYCSSLVFEVLEQVSSFVVNINHYIY